MPEYRRPDIPGATVFLTIVMHQRRCFFDGEENVSKLRQAIATVKTEMPFEIVAAVILPDHLHFLWRLPDEDNRLSARVGKMKLLFTQTIRGKNGLAPDASLSRVAHRESDVWQRRSIDHVIRDRDDLHKHLDYIHYNPVKHGLATCPHEWPYSSFHKWVERRAYALDWCCSCGGRHVDKPKFAGLGDWLGE